MLSALSVFCIGVPRSIALFSVFCSITGGFFLASSLELISLRIPWAPPFQAGQELWGGLSLRPRATRQRCHSLTDSQLDPLNKSGVQPPLEAQSEAQRP